VSRRRGRRAGRWWFAAALSLGVLLAGLLGAARGVAQTTAGPQPASPALPQAGDLTLGGSAGTVLLGLSVRPAQPGPNTLLVYVLPLDGPTNPADVSVALQLAGQPIPLAFCSRSCRTADVRLDGGEHIDLRVDGPAGGSIGFDLPPLPAPDGSGLLQQVQTRMHRVQTVQVEETIDTGAGLDHLVYALQAPDRMRVDLDGAQTVFIGPTRYSRADAASDWQVADLGTSLSVPSFSWDLQGPNDAIVAARVVGAGSVDGVPTQALAFFKSADGTPFWFRLLVDDSGLVRQAEMNGQGHTMVDHYTNVDAPLQIDPPSP
jgi:hypothetical protein